jgi:hypothetical protein
LEGGTFSDQMFFHYYRDRNSGLTAWSG